MSDLSGKTAQQELTAAARSPADLLTAIDRFREATVLVVGDFILDRFVRGVIERISPEAPIPVLHGRDETLTLGGAGNVISNIVSLGGTAVPIAAIGNDAAGRTILAALENQGVDVSGILTDPSRMTSSKSRFSALNQQVLRFDEEEIRPLSGDHRQAIIERFRKHLSRADIVVLSDYGKGMLLDGVAAELIGLCTEAGKRVIVDPKGHDYSRYAGATVVSPNRKELGEAVGRPVADDEQVVRAARQLIDAHGFEFVLATRSEKGMSVIGKEDARHIPTQAREVFDVSGAGDTVVASFALSLAAGLDRQAAAAIANAAAGVVVGKRGTARVSSEELMAALFRSDATSHSERSVVDLDTAEQIATAWRREGLSVAFTNGCFDILHTGHVSLIQQARATADRLILGLNSDASVRRLKGESRPVNTARDRAFILSALAAVDLVVVFDEDTPLTLIERLRPDVLVKGADYTVETVVGADIVRAYGGRVVLARLVDGKSTTGLIGKISSSNGSN
ncbi:MAG TPA: D-glycero-beta-D-manno-heptose-7-phosphate kinase [Rhizobiaceae bacterium]|nr:D-glycero-beta-D-manno-heptose-7-phosphate kinase [Rhizobiaceae bacterium]